jgi:hypothetical protein
MPSQGEFSAVLTDAEKLVKTIVYDFLERSYQHASAGISQSTVPNRHPLFLDPRRALKLPRNTTNLN